MQIGAIKNTKWPKLRSESHMVAFAEWSWIIAAASWKFDWK